MHPIFTYLIQVNIALTLFYLLYSLVLKNDTFLRLRRVFFLSAIVFSLFYPFWTIPALSDFRISSMGLGEVEATVIVEGTNATILQDEGSTTRAAVPWARIISLVYIVVTFIFLLRFIGQLLSILRVNMRSERCSIAGIPVYRLEDDMTPFSFFNRIFIHTGNHSEAELSQILLHEQTHTRQWHSINIMLIELVCLFSWWNPFAWFMKREITMNLEYLADNGVLCEGVDSTEYQYHLLRLTYQGATAGIVNNFNVSQLKQRIMMMNKTKSPTLKLMKYLLILPLAFILILANSCVNQDKKEGRDVATESSAAVPGSADTLDIIPEEVDMIEDNSEVFVVVEKQPEFPGGNAAMMKFLGDNIKYPAVAQENGIQGRVIVNFVVEKDGALSDVQVARSQDAALDKEAVRVIESMPRWKPGTQRGEAVRVRYTLPVVFRLQN